MANRYLEIGASNVPSTGKVSFREGMANLIFQIPAMNSNLIPSSVRIVGKVQFFKSSGAAGSSPMAVDERLGVYSCFESLTSRSIRHQQTIENIRHYAHFLSNYLPNTSSVKDNISALSSQLLTFPNWKGFNESVVYSGKPQEFCCPLPCGLLNGTSDIPLSNDMLGGIELVLSLASDNQVIYSLTGKDSALNDAHYEFSDLKLVCEVQDTIPSDVKPVFTYQSISSYYDTINSQNANVSFNLGLSKVRSVVSSFIPSSYLNNRKQNGYSTLMLSNLDDSVANIKKVVWTKGGRLYPKHFELNSVIRDSPEQVLEDPVILKDYVSSIQKFSSNMRNTLSVINTSRDFTPAQTDTDPNDVRTQYTNIPDGGMVFGLGITYDELGGEGSDFRDENWGMNIQSGLTSNNPHSVFIFVNSEQSVFFNQNGIQVVQ